MRSCQPAHVELLRPEQGEHGPVPEVDAVADLTDEHERRPAQRSVQPARRGSDAAGEDDGRGEGQQREAASVQPRPRPPVEPDHHDRDQRQGGEEVEPMPHLRTDPVALGPHGEGGRRIRAGSRRPGCRCRDRSGRRRSRLVQHRLSDRPRLRRRASATTSSARAGRRASFQTMRATTGHTT